MPVPAERSPDSPQPNANSLHPTAGTGMPVPYNHDRWCGAWERCPGVSERMISVPYEHARWCVRRGRPPGRPELAEPIPCRQCRQNAVGNRHACSGRMQSGFAEARCEFDTPHRRNGHARSLQPPSIVHTVGTPYRRFGRMISAPTGSIGSAVARRPAIGTP